MKGGGAPIGRVRAIRGESVHVGGGGCAYWSVREYGHWEGNGVFSMGEWV